MMSSGSSNRSRRSWMTCAMGLPVGVSLLGTWSNFVWGTPPQRYERWDHGPPADPAFFPIAVWVQAPRHAAKYRAAGINTYVGLWNGPTEDQLEQLDRAGMKVVCDQNEVALRSEHRDIIIAWMHGDEPDNAQAKRDGKGYDPPILPEKIVRDYQRIQKKDPSRPVLLNLGQGVAYDQYIGRGTRRNHPEDYPEYIRGSDIVSFDIYPAVHDKPEVAGKLEFVALGVKRLREWATDDQVVWNCIECSRISNTKRKPTVNEIRSEVWMSIVHGSRGLIYFVHQFEPNFVEASVLQDAELLAGITEINERIQSLAAVINSPEQKALMKLSSSQGDGAIAATWRSHQGNHYCFVVGMTDQATELEWETPPSGVRVEVLGEARFLENRNGKLTDALPGYGVRLYRWG
ncbi:hypothetical protein SH467x_003164 [Pirellulaceae bacterium SH467]